MADSPLWVLDDGRIMGGGQRFALRLARYAPERVRLLCPTGSELFGVARGEGIDVAGAEFPDPDPRAAVAFVAAARRLRGELARMPQDAVLVGNSARAQALAVATLRRRLPLVHLMHEQESAERASARLVHRRFGRVVAVGANAAETYRRALGVEVGRVNNFLLAGEWEALAAARDSRLSGPVLGVIGRMIPEKGIVEAVSEVAALPEVRLQVAAPRQDAAYQARVEERIASLGVGDRVSLLGGVDDLTAFLAGIDVLLVPSVGHEGQPTAILEALGAGRPVMVRRPIFSGDYAGLPVRPYDGDLAPALAALPAEPAPLAELAARFGPEQALAALSQTV